MKRFGAFGITRVVAFATATCFCCLTSAQSQIGPRYQSQQNLRRLPPAGQETITVSYSNAPVIRYTSAQEWPVFVGAKADTMGLSAEEIQRAQQAAAGLWGNPGSNVHLATVTDPPREPDIATSLEALHAETTAATQPPEPSALKPIQSSDYVTEQPAPAAPAPPAPADYVSEAEGYTPVYGGDACCGAGCCGLGCSGCGCCPTPCCLPTYWIAGTEATFLAPDLNRGGVDYRIEDQFYSTPIDATFGSEDVDVDDFYVSPRLWLGVQRGCCGIVARYWHMQAGETAYDPFVFRPVYGDTPDFGYFIHNRLEAYTLDLEATRGFCCYDMKNQVSFGVRYASVSHDSALSADAQVDTGASSYGVLSGNARSNRRAYGTGFTTSLTGRKPLFCNSCIHLFYGLRGSVVWGKITNSVETDTIEVTSGATAGSYNAAFAGVNDAMFIGEAQLGAQVDYRVFCFPADAFFRVALEYQYWDAGEGSTTASSFAGFGGPAPAALSQGTATAYADGITMDLIGLSVATGFTW